MNTVPFSVISTLTCGRLSGVDVFAVRLTRGLIERGIDARLVLTNPDETVPDRMPLADDVPRDVFPANLSPSQRTRWLYNYLVQRSPCIYLPNYDYETSVVSTRLPKEVMTIGIVHSDDPMHYAHLRRLGSFWNAVVAVSQEIDAKIGDAFPRLASRTSVISYGVDTPASLEGREDGPLRILYAGRLEQTQKRVLDLPAILDATERLGVPVELTVIGAGEQKTNLLRAAEGHLKTGRMIVVDTVPNQEMPAFLRRADVFLLTSAFEGLPLALLEAMAFGCVPVVSDLRSGISEVIRERVNGYRVPVGDIACFAQRLQTLHEDANLRQCLGQNAHQTIVDHFRADRMVSSYLDLFERSFDDMKTGKYQRPWTIPGIARLREFAGQAQGLVTRTSSRAVRFFWPHRSLEEN